MDVVCTTLTAKMSGGHRLNLLSQIESRICLRQKLKQHGGSMFAQHTTPCLRIPTRGILGFYVHFCIGRLNLLRKLNHAFACGKSSSDMAAVYWGKDARQCILRHGCSMFAPHEKPCLRTKEGFKGLCPLKIPVDAGESPHSVQTQRKRGG